MQGSTQAARRPDSLELCAMVVLNMGSDCNRGNALSLTSCRGTISNLGWDAAPRKCTKRIHGELWQRLCFCANESMNIHSHEHITRVHKERQNIRSYLAAVSFACAFIGSAAMSFLRRK